MSTITVKVTRVYHYSKEEIMDMFPNIKDETGPLCDAAIKLAQTDFSNELSTGEISPNTDDFLFTIKR